MATVQTDRILQLTPKSLEKDFLLPLSMRFTEGLSKLYRLELDLVHPEDGEGYKPTPVDPKKVIGEPMVLSVTQEDGTSRFFNGICVEFTRRGRNPNFSFYKAVVVPEVWRLTQVKQSRIFQQKSVPDVLKQVFDQLNVKFDIKGTFEPRNYCVQYRETDFDFASRVMEEEGIYYYFEHTAEGHTMILANTPDGHREQLSRSEIPYILDRSKLVEEWMGSIHSFDLCDRLRTGDTELRDYTFQKPTSDFLANRRSNLDIGGNKKLQVYDYPGEYAKRFDGIGPGGSEQPTEIEKIYPDLDRTVAIRQQAIDAEYHRIFALSDSAACTAGYRFKLTNHPNSDFNTEHVIVDAVHEADQSPDYISGAPAEEPYRVSLELMPLTVPFRPARVTEKPIVHGSQTATVVGRQGDEIFVDKYGRVKVQFNWDRLGKRNESSSCWVRVGTSIAGNKWGTMFIPRVGQEVIVSFLEGDPDQPLIVGEVYNQQSMPQYNLPEFKTMTYIRTNSSPNAKGHHELRFEDKAGKEQIFMHCQKRYDLRVRGSMYETCGGTRQESIGGSNARTTGGTLDLKIQDATYIGIKGKLNEAATGEVVEDYQGSHFTKVGTKHSLNAQEIIVEAKTKISLKVGASCIVIEPSLITIASAMVKINSGGYGTETGDPVIDDPLNAAGADTGEPGYLDRPRTGGGGGGRNRRQLRSQHHVYPPRPGESAAFTAMRNRLNTSAQGRHALEVFERNNVQVTNNPGGVVYSGGPTNTVNLDPTPSPSSAGDFVHEMTHAQAEHDGTGANVQTQNRADYIDHQLREDANAERRAYEAEQEMNAAGGSEQYNSQTRTNYQNALAAERARLQAAEPGISEEELNRRSHDAAEAAILQDYRNGNVNTGNTGQTYVDYWGSDHDARHGSGAGGPAPRPHNHGDGHDHDH